VLDVELNRHLEELGAVTESADPAVLTRTYMSPAHRRAAARLRAWLEEAGASRAWVDAVGNVHGHFDGQDGDKAKAVVVGSHYDTVVDGGKYDGTMGVLVAVAAAKALALEARAVVAAGGSGSDDHTAQLLASGAWSSGKVGGPDVVVVTGTNNSSSSKNASPPSQPPLLRGGGLRVVAFADEEGIRFRSTFLGSRALAGTLLRYGQLDAKDRDGVSLADVIAQNLDNDDEQQQHRRQRRPHGRADAERAVAQHAPLARTGVPTGASAYVEVHIEQGPVLEAQSEPLGVVSGIAGQTWLEIEVKGEQAHAGTVPMGELRRDALAAAAEIVSAIERICTFGEEEGGEGPAHNGAAAAITGGAAAAAAAGRKGAAESPPPLLLKHDAREGLVCTVGSLSVAPGQVNVIPRLATFTADVRSATDAHRASALAAIRRAVERVCASRGGGLACAVRMTHDAKAVRSDPGVVRSLSAALARSRVEWDGVLAATGGEDAAVRGGGGLVVRAVRGWLRRLLKGGGGGEGCAAAAPPPPVLVSGAGHDAMAMAEVAPVGMVFVRCRGGVSHNPAEYASPADVARSAHALLAYLRGELLPGAKGEGGSEAAAATGGSDGEL
jgi:allantoate deiminase